MKKDLKELYKEYTKRVLPHENPAGAVDGTDVQAPGYEKGGKLGSGERFAKLENKLSHQKGIKDPGALAASIGRKKYGNKKMNKMAQAHMDEGGQVNTGPVLDPDKVNQFVQGFKGHSEGGKIGYDQGTDPNPVQSDDSDPFQKLRSLYNQYMNPKPAPSPEDIQQQKYQQIRDAQQADRNQSASQYMQPGEQHYNKGGMIKGYADGTDPIPVQDEPQDIQGDQLEGQYINEEENAAPGESELPNIDPNAIDSEIAQADAGKDLAANAKLNVQPEDKKEDEAVESKVAQDVDQKDNEDTSQDQSEENQAAQQSGVEDRGSSSYSPSDEQTLQNSISQPKASVQVDDQDITSPQEAPQPSQQPNIQQQLAQAQQQVMANQNANQIAQYAALAGARAPGVNPAQALGVINNQAKNANLPIEQLEQRVQMQEQDPNSAVSQASRDLYEKLTGRPAPKDLTAYALKSVSPVFEKYVQAQATAEVKKEISKNQIQSREDIAKGNQDLKRQLAEQQAENRKAAQEQQASQKQNQALTQTQQLLESARGNPAAAQAEKDLYSTQKANSLINMYGNANKLSPQQVNLLVSEVSKIATGGVPTGHEQEALQPGTLASKSASLYSKLVNNPTPANAGAFIKQFKDYNDVLAKDAQKVIQDKYGRIIETRKKVLGDDNYSALQDQYINRFNPDVPPVDSDLSKMSDDQLKAYIKAHGGQ